MFARMVATALLVAGIGIPSLALAADAGQAEHFTMSPPSATPATAPTAVAQPAAPTSPTVQPVAQPKVPAVQAAPAQPVAQPAAQPAPSIPAAQQSSQQAGGDDEEAAPSSTDTGEATPSGPLTSTDKIVKSFMQLDTDKSNAVSFDEYMTMVQQRAKDRFDAMDANHDGQVTPDEYRQFWLHRMARWYRLKR